MRNLKSVATAGVAALATAAGSAMAQYDGITAGLDVADIVTAIVACGVILVAPGFAKWATKKIGGFFG